MYFNNTKYNNILFKHMGIFTLAFFYKYIKIYEEEFIKKNKLKIKEMRNENPILL